MTKLPSVSGRECVSALQRAGFEVVSQKGSHIKLRRGGVVVVVPNHRELGRGVLRAIINQAGLTVDEFVALLND